MNTNVILLSSEPLLLFHKHNGKDKHTHNNNSHKTNLNTKSKVPVFSGRIFQTELLSLILIISGTDLRISDIPIMTDPRLNYLYF